MPKPFDRKPLGDLKGPSDKNCFNRQRGARWVKVSCKDCGHIWHQRVVVFNRNRKSGRSPQCYQCYMKDQKEIEAAMVSLQKKKASLSGVARKLHYDARMKEAKK